MRSSPIETALSFFRLLCTLLSVILIPQTSLLAETGFGKVDKVEFSKIIIISESVAVELPYGSDFLLMRGADTLRLERDFSLEYGRIKLMQPHPDPDTLVLIWQRDLGLLDRQYALRPFMSVSSEGQAGEPAPLYVERKENSTGKLKLSGTKTFWADVSDQGRVDLSQGLALTLSGDLGHDILVRGSFSDRGLRESRLVTKRFSELQNIYLEVESPQLSGRFGNFELREERFAYLNFVRLVQGLSVGYRTDDYSLGSSLSVPPGNFGTNSFLTQQGFYGPYLLRDQSGSAGVAVIENSETIWFNGRKLRRGRDEDYYLDYPRGELYFTGRLIVDSDDRVRVDFEYQRREYRKTLATATASGELLDEKLNLELGAASLIASGDDPLDFTLTADDRAALAAAGDDPAQATLSGARFVGSGNGEYVALNDSLVGIVYSFVGDSLGDYRVSFTESDTGDYVYLGGGEYQHVGKGLGRYLPINSVPLPEAAQVVSLAGDYRLSESVSMHSELALSDHDRNRLSSLDDGDNLTGAGNLIISMGHPIGSVSGRVSAEYLPANFFRFSRLDLVDEDYLWQRSTTPAGNRQRYLATATTKFSPHDRSDWEIGYTRESGDFESFRAGLQSNVTDLKHTSVGLSLNAASSISSYDDRRLISFKPQVETDILPVLVTVAGEYDQQRVAVAGENPISDSRRELAMTLSHAGISLGGRQRENWSKEDVWQLEQKKRTLKLGVDRPLPGQGKLALNLLSNRVESSDKETETYQTGSLDLICRDILEILDVNGRMRLNRRGQWQTNETFLKVDDGEGDYVLVDSVYVPQARGGYIRVTEQVGNLTQRIEAEKQLQLDLSLEHLFRSGLTRGTSFRYDLNTREIGRTGSDFAYRWLVPINTYFDDDVAFSLLRREYRLRRYEARLGLRIEIGYRRKSQDNLLDVRRPFRQNSEEGELILSQRVGTQDLIELAADASNTHRSQVDTYQLNIRKRNVAARAMHSYGPWEFSLKLELGRESADSLSLRLVALRAEPQVSYNLTNVGRVLVSIFAYSINEEEGRAVLREMADGFPEGANFGGRASVDLRIAGNFDFRLSANGEIRDGENNRYYLRSELISRFK